MYIFYVFMNQIDIGERRASLSLQGLGAKLSGCGTFQVSWFLSNYRHIIFLAYVLQDFTDYEAVISCRLRLFKCYNIVFLFTLFKWTIFVFYTVQKM